MSWSKAVTSLRVTQPSGDLAGNSKTQVLAVNKATGNSINSMQAQKTALQGLRNMADVTGNEFKQLTKDIALLDQKMKDLQNV